MAPTVSQPIVLRPIASSAQVAPTAQVAPSVVAAPGRELAAGEDIRFAPPSDPAAAAAARPRAIPAPAVSELDAPVPPPVPAPPPVAIARPAARAVGPREIAAAGGGLALLLALGGAVYWSWAHPTLAFTNDLSVPVELTVGASRVGLVGPGDTREMRVPRDDAMPVQWRALPPADQGQPMGQPVVAAVRARFPNRPLATGVVRATAVWPSGAAFQPLVTNATGVALHVVVNPDLSVDGRSLAADCGCEVAPGARAYSVGFYELVGNSAVRAVMPDGRSATFRDLGSHVDRHSGVVRLRFTPDAFRVGG